MAKGKLTESAIFDALDLMDIYYSLKNIEFQRCAWEAQTVACLAMLTVIKNLPEVLAGAVRPEIEGLLRALREVARSSKA